MDLDHDLVSSGSNLLGLEKANFTNRTNMAVGAEEDGYVAACSGELPWKPNDRDNRDLPTVKLRLGEDAGKQSWQRHCGNLI
uniref:Uncharacterized protein n=1 Tax=Oryza brachyantha TaxID=4533 RepID=J3MDX0_ORYBR